MAGARPKADVDRRPNDPGQDIQARQSLPARSVRAGRMGRADQTEELGTSRAQALDRCGQKKAASQRPCDRARQQAGPHRMERSGSRKKLRSEEDRRGNRPARLNVESGMRNTAETYP